MVFHYPNGHPSHYNEASKQKMQGKDKSINFANRGMRFEDAINQSNDYYRNHNLAVIHKKPIPLQIVKVDYPKRSAAVIREAYFKEASTTDYNGVYKGYYLDFEAKETKNKTSFPLKNFHEHQIAHMEKCMEQDGLCFVLLWFSSLKRCFFLDSKQLVYYWRNKENQKKSMPITTIEKNAIEIQPKIAPRIPYLEAVDQYLQAKEKN
ncbi:recombination protein U [Tetragenococcus halophilus subsp. halophilus]|uniref:Holliday junction resolvase RecU n=1 Tax=Tetragenococcus halophilus subsp. halophilus TaxID=1513897 RepID=A0A2H6CTC5_TETHA|nr:Holliday junction resolvase RecU [Tetragenococcus halophilus]GBD68245.1 recombination protein U [Tetragenococcus halophilus subsp. halophilus]